MKVNKLKLKTLHGKPIYTRNKWNSRIRIIGFKVQSTAAGQGKTYYGLDRIHVKKMQLIGLRHGD